MFAKLENDYGTIGINNDVIARIAGLATTECYGIVGMAVKNVKDGIVHLLKMESLAKGVKIRPQENGIDIDVHIIVEYGTNISAIADSIIGAIKYRVEEFTGVKVNLVNIFVEGIRVDN